MGMRLYLEKELDQMEQEGNSYVGEYIDGIFLKGSYGFIQ